MNLKEQIQSGKASLGIELGSTRIKAILVGESPNEVIGSGSFEWENVLVDGLWSYPLEQVWEGIQKTFQDLQSNLESSHGVRLKALRSIGISAMMHGYLAFDNNGKLLVPFRTWRNTNTQQAAVQLTEVFGMNIPLRWSIAHLQQVILEKSDHVSKIDFLTTLAGFVHYKLTGQKVLGIGDASGMFPIDPVEKNYDQQMIQKFRELNQDSELSKDILEILPEVLLAGEDSGRLTTEGAKLLDPEGELEPGAIVAPPEGDAGTGMVVTNAIAPTTGNISVGTSVFAMVVMEKPLGEIHHEIDVVATPVGDSVAMVHCNNGASELAAWVSVFEEFSKLSGSKLSTDQVYQLLLKQALEGETDAGGLLAYNYLAGEPIAGLASGRPTTIRTPDSDFSLANFMRSQVFGVFATLSIGMEVLRQENVKVSQMNAHGGLFRTSGVAQQILSAAIEAPISVASGASEGGAWGMAILASFAASDHDDLAEYLSSAVFADAESVTMEASQEEIAGYRKYLARYKAGLSAVRNASEEVY
jgi:sugar (pentulose or hexulose) kinase